MLSEMKEDLVQAFMLFAVMINSYSRHSLTFLQIPLVCFHKWCEHWAQFVKQLNEACHGFNLTCITQCLPCQPANSISMSTFKNQKQQNPDYLGQ
jgi:hypothetical protein